MIRLASEQDLPAIAAIYEAILDHEDATGLHYTGWQREALGSDAPVSAMRDEALLAILEQADARTAGDGTANQQGRDL